MKEVNLIFLDGAPSSGKTTVALTLQEILKEPYLYISFQALLNMLPHKGLSSEGITYAHSNDPSGYPILKFNFGPTVEKLMNGYREILLGLISTENAVIAEGILSRPQDLDLFTKTFQFCRAYLISLYAPLDILEKRESSRGEPLGLARGRYEEVYFSNKLYDLKIDTSLVSSQEAALEIKKLIETKEPLAIRQMANTIESFQQKFPENLT